MNALILLAALTSGQCSDCVIVPNTNPTVVQVSVTPHDASVAFAGTSSLTSHRQIAPVRNSRARRAHRGGWYLGKRGWYLGKVLRCGIRGRRCR